VPESESSLSIIISACALAISILSYANNKKQLDVIMHKENLKEVVQEAIEALRGANNTLKDLSHPFHFTNIDQITTCMAQELHEKDKIRLSIRYESLKINDNVIFINSLKDSREFASKVRGILFSIWRAEGKIDKFLQYRGPSIESSVDFNIQPDVICAKSLDFGDMFTNFIKLENDIINLTRVQFFIEPYDSELFNLLNEDYECILSLLYEAFSKQVHDIELVKNMTPEDIKDALCGTVNHDQITEKTTLMSANLRKRVNELKRELAVQYLTN
jgi:hypothetical protein